MPLSVSTNVKGFSHDRGEISSIVPYDRFSINLYNPETLKSSLFCGCSRRQPGRDQRKNTPSAKRLRCAARHSEQKEVVIHDLSQEKDDLESVKTMREAGLNATFAYPMIVHGGCLAQFIFHSVHCRRMHAKSRIFFATSAFRFLWPSTTCSLMNSFSRQSGALIAKEHT